MAAPVPAYPEPRGLLKGKTVVVTAAAIVGAQHAAAVQVTISAVRTTASAHAARQRVPAVIHDATAVIGGVVVAVHRWLRAAGVRLPSIGAARPRAAKMRSPAEQPPHTTGCSMQGGPPPASPMSCV